MYIFLFFLENVCCIEKLCMLIFIYWSYPLPEKTQQRLGFGLEFPSQPKLKQYKTISRRGKKAEEPISQNNLVPIER